MASTSTAPRAAAGPGDSSPSTPPSPRPQIKAYLESVLAIFADHIPEDEYRNCTRFVHDGLTTISYPEDADDEQQREHLRQFVAQQLDRIARYEYSLWVNGGMPFVALREIQIWRLHQFCRFIWKWNIPDNEHVATIFNLTKRRAGSLVGDFVARFRKVYIYPLILRSLFRLLRKSYDFDVEPERIDNVRCVRVPLREERFLDEMNVLFAEPLVRAKLGPYRAWVVPEHLDVMFVPVKAIEFLLDEDLGIQARLEALYPLPDEDEE